LVGRKGAHRYSVNIAYGGVNLFSVIIPSKDRPTLLLRALRSAFAQRDCEFEVIVVDDGGGTGASAALQGGQDRLKVFSTGGLGQVNARNLGVSKAQGRYIAFLDDDDWWADEYHLRDCERVLSDRSLAYASGRILLETRLDHSIASIAFDAFMDRQSVYRDNTLLVPGIAYPRRLHADLGPFDETLPYYWAWDWYLRLAAAGIAFCRSAGSGVRVTAHVQSVSGANNETERRNNLARLVNKHGLRAITLKNHLSIAMEGALQASQSTTYPGRPAPRLTSGSDPTVDQTPY
jgi:glycosyltransferase involved in cell wall biosynthesis